MITDHYMVAITSKKAEYKTAYGHNLNYIKIVSRDWKETC